MSKQTIIELNILVLAAKEKMKQYENLPLIYCLNCKSVKEHKEDCREQFLIEAAVLWQEAYEKLERLMNERK